MSRGPVFVRGPGGVPVVARGDRDPVAGGWNDYSPREVEDHAREIHYEVLRSSGFDEGRALEIARASSSGQGRLLEDHRGERPHVIGTSARARRRARVVEPSGFDIRDHMAGLRAEPGSE